MSASEFIRGMKLIEKSVLSPVVAFNNLPSF